MSSTSPTPRPPLSPAAVDALVLDTMPYLSCDECFDQMDTYVEAIVNEPGHHARAMAAPLRGCPACAEEADALTDLVQAHQG